MANRFPNSKPGGRWRGSLRTPRSGAISIQILVFMVPVFFGMMGFAFDLGRLYLVRGELSQAANAAALAAAAQLMGTTASLDRATATAQAALAQNKYNFGSLTLGQDSGNLTSTISDPSFFATVSGALGTDSNATAADGSTARHVQVNVTADAPLLFWSLLSLGTARKTPIAARAVAGVSAPLCTACGIEPFAIAALDATDTVNFGFGDPTAGSNFTLVANCTGTPAPLPLAGTGILLRYTIINRFDASSTTVPDDYDQLYRIGAQGLLSSTTANPTGSTVPLGCVGINDPLETLWTGAVSSAVPSACARAAPQAVTAALCGMYSRFDNATPPAGCTTNVTSFATLSRMYQPDTDVTTGQADPYVNYTGSGRRVITIPIVDTLAPNNTATMTVLGFRQFLLQLNLDGTFFNPLDTNGRFVAQYIGSPMPIKQGYIDDRYGQSCPAPVASGPGKVVLHR